MAYYRITLKWTQQSLGTAINVFYFRNQTGSPTDAQLRNETQGYLEDMFKPLEGHMDAGVSVSDVQLDEVNLLNETIRSLGSVATTISPNLTGDQLALHTAASMFGRTDKPKTRGSKRIPGIGEVRHIDGLFTNPLLAAMAQCALAYISNRGSILTWTFDPGVISTVTNTWHSMNSNAVITNIPGTQVTRKVGRGV